MAKSLWGHGPLRSISSRGSILSPQLLACMVAGLLGLFVYLNTLPADFAFDDNFAVVYNGDVTNDANPLLGLLHNDFWGQNIRSEQSHKSYRPLTVLCFRLLRQSWAALPASLKKPVKAWRASVEHQPSPPGGGGPSSGSGSGSGSNGERPRPPGLDPLPFHAANVMMHALVSMLVCRLAYYLFTKRAQLLLRNSRITTVGIPGACSNLPGVGADVTQAERQLAGTDAAGAAQLHGSAAGLRQRKGLQASSQQRTAVAAPSSGTATNSPTTTTIRGSLYDAPSLHHQQHQHQRQQGCSSGTHPAACSPSPDLALLPPWQRLCQVHAPALFTAAAFALHPVHTEAVSGIVGAAELLCAALSIPALLMFMRAADANVNDANDRHGNGDVQHKQRAAPAAGTQQASSSTATTSSSGGGSISGLRHWLYLAAAIALSWLAALSKEIGITVVGAMLAYDVLLVPLVPPAAQPCPRASRAARLRKLLRCVALCAGGVGYVKLRSVVAVDQLVRIYRKVENPIAFAPSPLARALSTAHLHARYAALLIWPRHLSADWSYNCVPLVERWGDVRNTQAAVLYGALLLVLLAARPWKVLADWWRAWRRPPGRNGSGSSSGDLQPAAVATGTAGTLETAAAPAPAAAGVHYASPDGDACGVCCRALWRWRLVVAAGLVVGPYFPASNVLFYVGTFIGERLLYFPSIGFLLLTSEAAASALWALAPQILLDDPTTPGNCLTAIAGPRRHGWGWRWWGSSRGKSSAAGASVGASGSGSAVAAAQGPAPKQQQQQQQPTHQPQNQSQRQQADAAAGGSNNEEVSEPSALACFLYRCLTWLLLAAAATTLALYAARTWERNWDWLNEERLFEAALKVCPDSAKVQLNSGILQRRRQQLPAALVHFERARAIEPGYCEPGYWVGLTRVNMGDMVTGLDELERSLSCKYVAAEAMKALNTLYTALHSASPSDPLPLLRWGRLLMNPAVRRLPEGCDTLEQAAMMAAGQGGGAAVAQALAACTDAMQAAAADQRPQHQRQLPAGAGTNTGSAPPLIRTGGPEDVALSGPAARRIRACVEARRPVYAALAAHGPASTHTRTALYGYLQQLQQQGGSGGGGGGATGAASGSNEDLGFCRFSAAAIAIALASNDGAAGTSGAAAAAAAAEAAAGRAAPHMALVHAVQSSDPEDPWLQAEWAEVMLVQGRLADAYTHMSVSGMLMARQVAAMQQGRPPGVMALTGGPLTPLDALTAMADAYGGAARLQPRAAPACDMMLSALEARAATLPLLATQQQQQRQQQQQYHQRQRDEFERAVSGARASMEGGAEFMRASMRHCMGSHGERLSALMTRFRRAAAELGG